MAKNRYTGKSGLVKVNDNGDGSTFNTVGLSRSLTPPPEVKAKIDVTGMEDTVFQEKAGIEQSSEFVFTEIWDSADTTDSAIDTLYGSEDAVKWQVILSDGTNTWTQEFSGWVSGITPQSVDGTTAVTRQVTVARTTAITHSVA